MRSLETSSSSAVFFTSVCIFWSVLVSRIACVRDVFRGFDRRACRCPEYAFLVLWRMGDLSMKCPVSASSLERTDNRICSLYLLFPRLQWICPRHDSGLYTGSDYLPGVLYLRYCVVKLFVSEVFA